MINRIKDEQPGKPRSKRLRKAISILLNRYVLISLVMIVWIGFFDRYNLIRRVKDSMDLQELKNESDYYNRKVEEVTKTRDELFSDKQKLEKFARERYFMKKDNEDVFIVDTTKPQHPVN